MRAFFSSPFLLVFFLENAWAQDPDTLLAWDIPQPPRRPPPTSEYVLLSDGGSSALQSGGASLLAQANQQKQQQQQQPPPNSQSPAEFDNSWNSNEPWDCVAGKTNNGRAGPAASPQQQQQPKGRRRRAPRWKNKKRDQQPDTCSQTGPTYMQPKISPNLIKNPALPVNPTKPERFEIPVFPGSNALKGESPTCLQKTLGWLPLGICDSGVASDRYDSVFDVFGVVASLDRQATTGLDNCVLGTSFFPLFFSFFFSFLFACPILSFHLQLSPPNPPNPLPQTNKKKIKRKGKRKVQGLTFWHWWIKAPPAITQCGAPLSRFWCCKVFTPGMGIVGHAEVCVELDKVADRPEFNDPIYHKSWDLIGGDVTSNVLYIHTGPRCLIFFPSWLSFVLRERERPQVKYYVIISDGHRFESVCHTFESIDHGEDRFYTQHSDSLSIWVEPQVLAERSESMHVHVTNEKRNQLSLSILLCSSKQSIFL